MALAINTAICREKGKAISDIFESKISQAKSNFCFLGHLQASPIMCYHILLSRGCSLFGQHRDLQVLAGPNFLSMHRAFMSYSQPIRFAILSAVQKEHGLWTRQWYCQQMDGNNRTNIIYCILRFSYGTHSMSTYSFKYTDSWKHNKHTITGRMWVICPVSSNTITDVDIVCVTAADMAAAPVPQTKQYCNR